MSEVPIPPTSLERLRTAFMQFEQLAAVISEAMGLGPTVAARLDLHKGVFVIQDGQVEPDRVDGIAQEVSSG